jgi:hypothetical protein
MVFQDLPKNIQESMFNPRIDNILEEIRQKAGIYDETIIPNIYYKLITKEIPAFDFINSLAETGIGLKIASAIAKEIKERILESERYPLFKWGIDISDIKTEEAPQLEELNLESFLKEEEVEITPKGMEFEDFVIKIPIVKSEEKEIKEPSLIEKLKEEPKDKPFILQEKPKESILSKEVENKENIPIFNFGQIGFFKNKKDEEGKNIFARIETPPQSSSKETKKVVHYSEARSSLNPWGSEEGFLEPSIENKKISKEETSPIKEENSKEKQKEEDLTIKNTILKNKKNIIDLRNIYEE